MSISKLRSTKFDGSLHYTYAVEPLRITEDRLVTYAAPGAPVDSHRGSWLGKSHLLSLYRRGTPYVLHVRWDGAWRPDFLYVDIASAVDWDDQAVRYVDLDLDLIQRAGSSQVELDDEDEFEIHRLRWHYPEALVAGCWSAVAEVRALFATGQAPFSSAMFAWRPGSELPC